jgi:secretion/DNA translocation related TadE-like protein
MKTRLGCLRTATRALRHEEGSGSVLGVTMLIGMVALLCVVLPLGRILAQAETLRGVADAAALAAADTSSGRTGGVPCEMASRVAEQSGAVVQTCRVDTEGNAEVKVTGAVLGFRLEVAARAGPPPGGASVR